MIQTTLIVVLFIKALTAVQQPCVSRNYGNGGTVCVCNMTYCDTVPPYEKLKQPQLSMYTSNKAGLRFQTSTGKFTSATNSAKNIIIDSKIKFQTILGFGGAFTDAAGININSLPSKMQDMILKSYFSKDGSEYNLCRVPMGGSDFSVRAYSYDDGPPDPYLLNFQLAPEDFLYKIPYIQKASSLSNNKLELFATPWTAPKWMKTNDQYNGYGFIRESMYQPWANYFLKFLDEYQKHNISFWGITTGNEPSDALIPLEQLEVVGWPSWLIGPWIRDYLGPTIRSSNHSNIKIMILDDQRAFLPWYVVKALRDSAARKYVDGIAVHWYLDEFLPPELLNKTHTTFPEKFILATEASNVPGFGERAVTLGSWEQGEKYSIDIIEDMHNWVSGWVDWNLVLDLEGGPNYIENYVDAAIIVNSTNKEFYKQPMYYHLGHFSKFIPRKSVRIYSESPNGDVEVVAFLKPDNGTTVIILNRNTKAVSLNLYDASRGTAEVKLSGKSITTVLY